MYSCTLAEPVKVSVPLAGSKLPEIPEKSSKPSMSSDEVWFWVIETVADSISVSSRSASVIDEVIAVGASFSL